MLNIRPIRLLLSLVVLCFMVWKYAPWPTRTLVFKEQNCQCQIPYNWTWKNNPTFIMDARRPYGGSVFISAKPASPTLRIDDPAFSNAIKNKVTADGYEILNESRDAFKGHVAYAYTMRKTIKGKLIYTHSVNFIVGKFRYDLLSAKQDADPSQDSQLQKALDSFSLIVPDVN